MLDLYPGYVVTIFCHTEEATTESVVYILVASPVERVIDRLAKRTVLIKVETIGQDGGRQKLIMSINVIIMPFLHDSTAKSCVLQPLRGRLSTTVRSPIVSDTSYIM